MKFYDSSGREKVVAGGGGGGAPTTAEYLVGAGDATLTAERVVTGTATVTWDLATAGQAKANVPDDAITYAKIQNVSATDKVLGRSTAGAGDVEEIACTSAGRAIIDDADAAAQRTTLGLGALAVKSTVATADIDADAVTYAKIQNISATDKVLGRSTAGAGDTEEIACTSAGRALIDDVDAAAQRTTLGLGSLATLSTVNDSNWSGTDLAVANGGTGQSTQTAGMDALSPTTTKGDILVDNGTNVVRLAVGVTNGHVLTVDSVETTGVKWAATSGGVSDGDKGDITVTGSGATWTIDADVVTFAKMQDIATDRLLGRDTAATGNVEELTVGGGVEFSGSGGIQRSALTGDVTASAGSNATTIANDAVTFAKVQNIATARILGRTTAASGDIEELTAGEGISMPAGSVALDLNELTTAVPDFDDKFPFTDVSASNVNRSATGEEVASLSFESSVRRRRYGLFLDYTSAGGANTSDMVSTTSGAGAAIANGTGDTNHIGLQSCSTGTTATGRVAFGSGPAVLRLGGGLWVYEALINIAALSTSAQRYQLVVGFMDTANAANQVDGAFLLYDEGGVSTGSAASANWQCVTASNSTRTFTTTGTAVAAAAFVRLRIEVNAAATSIEFFVDGTSVATHTTNIPTAAGRETGFGRLIIKSVGTTASTYTTDYDLVSCDFTTAR